MAHGVRHAVDATLVLSGQFDDHAQAWWESSGAQPVAIWGVGFTFGRRSERLGHACV